MTRTLISEPFLSVELAAEFVNAEEWATAAAFVSGRRRSEYLSWRAIVRRELGADVRIGYDAIGAPIVEGGPFISVAHCPGRVAVCISDRRCGVDVESERRNFSRVASRCMTPQELALSSDPLLPGVLWCAKETLYKYAGRVELDLLRDLSVESVDLDAGSLGARIENGALLQLSVRREDGYILVYLL